VPGLHFARVQSSGDNAILLDWRRVHNLIIPTSPLTADEVGELAWLTYADRDRVSPVDQLIFDHLHGNGQLR
jgi:hypothetical protein